MKVTFVKKELKEALATVKRVFAKNKDAAKVFIQANQDGIVVQSVTKKLITFHELKNVGGGEFAFSTNPIEFEKLLKPKGVEIEFELEEEKIEGEAGSVPIQVFQKKAIPQFKELVEFKDKEVFLSILKEAETLLGETMQDCTSYLKLSSKRARAVEQKRAHFYRLDEEFNFNEGYVHFETVSVLAKSLSEKSTLKHGMFRNAFVINENDKTTYLINIDHNVMFPDLSPMSSEKNTKLISSFEVDATAFNDLAKNYKTKVKEIEFIKKADSLLVDPRNEEFKTYKLELSNIQGEWEKSLFDASAIKGLFMGYSGQVKVEHRKFKNIYGEVGYMWRITTPYKITMAAGITEPDWDSIKVKTS